MEGNMNITFSTETCAFGEMLKISSNDLTVGLTNQLGARISYINAFDCGNICYYDEHFAETSNLKNGKVWKQLGGHRLWKTPEDDDCYLYDNTPCQVEKTLNGAILLSPLREDGLQFTLSVEFLTETTLKISHTIANRSNEIKTFGLWGITALKNDGKVLLPLNTNFIPLLPTRNIVFWPYDDVNDKRIKYSNNGIEISGDKKGTPLKVGTFNNNGEIYYANKNIIFNKTIENVTNNIYYPDYNCNIECYTNSNILEMETLSQTYQVEPNQTVNFDEKWSFTRKE